ncbi:MAG: hypothetical protein II453_10480, partial [Alphaproteobacteria bacterium]|nr:hypothetical protein [Alphaproteobacteria bacterium]
MNQKCWKFAQFVDGNRVWSKGNKGIDVKIVIKTKLKRMVGQRKYALVLYLERNGFKRIARIMSKIFNKNYRYQTIMNWIKKAGLRVLKENSKQEQMDV